MQSRSERKTWKVQSIWFCSVNLLCFIGKTYLSKDTLKLFNCEVQEVMHICGSSYAFAILIGAILMVLMMSGSAEVSIFNCSQDLPGSLSKERQYLSNSTEPDSGVVSH